MRRDRIVSGCLALVEDAAADVRDAGIVDEDVDAAQGRFDPESGQTSRA